LKTLSISSNSILQSLGLQGVLVLDGLSSRLGRVNARGRWRFRNGRRGRGRVERREFGKERGGLRSRVRKEGRLRRRKGRERRMLSERE
jgi:hypothetical protein